MPPRARWIPLLTLLLTAFACTLPGATSPTPFTFPTPNLTLTAVFAPTLTPSAVPPTLPPIGPSPSPIGPTSEPPQATATGSGSLDTRPNGSVLTADFLGTAPTIDGDLDEWKSDPYRVSQIVYGASLWSGASDLSANLYLGWDNSNLYLALRVTDDAHAQNSTGSLLYRGDDVEIQFDANLAVDFNVASLSSDDYQIGLSPGDFGTRSPEAYRWFPASLSGPLASVVVEATQTTDGYDLEARIPWAIFNVTPSTGSRYGFALSLSDNDLAGSSIQQSMVSTVSSRELTDPTSWGTLALGE